MQCAVLDIGFCLLNVIDYCIMYFSFAFIFVSAMSCVPISADSPLQVNVDGFLIGTVATFQCDDGYRLEGETSITCLPNQHWSSNAPTCHGMWINWLYQKLVETYTMNDMHNLMNLLIKNTILKTVKQKQTNKQTKTNKTKQKKSPIVCIKESLKF